MTNISIRLKAIADFVKPNSAVCDIGCDHGHLAIYLMKQGIAKTVIAADIGEKPLANAAKNIAEAKETDIELRLCDGLSGIDPSETDTVIIAGIGGEVIAGILERGKTVAARDGVSLILQPTTSPEFLRRFLCENGYEIITEVPVFENGKIYSVMSATFTGKPLTLPEHFYFTGLVKPDSDWGKMYLNKQLNRNLSCAEALKTVAGKKQEYCYYQQVADGISAYIEAFKEG